VFKIITTYQVRKVRKVLCQTCC